MIEPVEIIKEDDSEISIVWSDGKESRYRAANLRRACPCASCVNEWTGEKVLKPDSISDDLTIKDLSLVGRYALNFSFGDNHDTGIFSFKYLRNI